MYVLYIKALHYLFDEGLPVSCLTFLLKNAIHVLLSTTTVTLPWILRLPLKWMFSLQNLTTAAES